MMSSGWTPPSVVHRRGDLALQRFDLCVMVDLIVVGLTIAASAWGYRRGLSSSGLALVGFGVGALLGSRVAPLLLDGGIEAGPMLPNVGNVTGAFDSSSPRVAHIRRVCTELT